MGRKRKGLASKSWPEPIGGAACARRLSYSRAPYFYCPHPARHPQVPKSPETLRASGHWVQRLSRQDAGAEASFCLFWPRATASVRRRRLGHSQVSALRPLCPVPSPVPPGGGGPGTRRHKAPAERGVYRLQAQRVGREGRRLLSRLGPASAGRDRQACRRWLGAAKHPGRSRSRRKVARARGGSGGGGGEVIKGSEAVAGGSGRFVGALFCCLGSGLLEGRSREGRRCRPR